MSSAATLTKTSGVGASAAEKHRGLWNTVGKTRCQERARWRKMNLDRKLLMAVTPWVGDVLLPCTLRTGKMTFDQTKGSGNPSEIVLLYVPVFWHLTSEYSADFRCWAFFSSLFYSTEAQVGQSLQHSSVHTFHSGRFFCLNSIICIKGVVIFVLDA